MIEVNNIQNKIKVHLVEELSKTMLVMVQAKEVL